MFTSEPGAKIVLFGPDRRARIMAPGRMPDQDQMAAVANFLVDVRTSSKDTLYNLEVSSVCVCVLGGGGGWELCVY